ncbi:MAG: copper-binding protein [Alphaproteobacteria bacterium]|nr:copper-binding protein [Alphaproteobacteria bacterium]
MRWIVLTCLLAGAAWAQTATGEGEVRRIDRDGGKVSIRHGPLAAFDMPPMTMVFRVKEPAMLDRMAPGDKIRFEVAKVDGVYSVLSFEKLP